MQWCFRQLPGATNTMTNERPNPDQLLARVESQDGGPRRGKLRIFFGYAAGVGKTYAMLEAAQRDKAAGIDVVVGYVEPHGRPATEALLAGLEALPARHVPYRGVTLREFDLDAALARKPKLILVDELAHTNAEGLRHAKRWQDVDELLSAGIDVYSTLNVQHVESLNDVVSQITGVVVRETLPDSVLEQADDIELVDLTPEELIDRLKAGKVYLPAQAERALTHFFQRTNLTALRELSVRQVAQRLSKQVEAARQEKAAKKPWATNERLLVCVGPSPTSAKLIRSAKRMATAFDAEWLAVATEASVGAGDARQRIARHLQLASRLGAETHTLSGDDVAQTILDFAVTRNVTKIVVGKSSQPRWRRLLFGTVVDALLERSGEIDVYVIRGEPEESPPVRSEPRSGAWHWANYAKTLAVIAICTLVGWCGHEWNLSEANVVMIFLLGVVFVAARYGRGPAVAGAIGNVLAFDFFFVPPYLKFTVNDAKYLITFSVMLLIGLVISALTARIKDQLQTSRQSQLRTDALFRLTRQLTEVAGPEFLLHTAGQQLRAIFDGDVVIYLREAKGPLQLRFGNEVPIAHHPVSAGAALWVADHDKVAGAGTDTLPNAIALFVPLIGSQRTIGAIGVKSHEPDRFNDPEQMRLLETCASLIALSLERDQSVLEATEAEMRVRAEELKNSLLSTVSHDLRTPLAVIAAGSASLLEAGPASEEGVKRETLRTIIDESRHLTRLVDNLLDMGRLDSGATPLNRQWHVLEEIVGAALTRVRQDLKQHHVHVEIPRDFPLLYLDDVLMGQVFMNLLENAARYTPPGSRIEISARRIGTRVEIRVADDGPGLPPGSERRVLEKFFRATQGNSDGRRGVGLGLAICQAIVLAHDGHLVARNRSTGGAEFVIELPFDRAPPAVVEDEPQLEAAA